MTKTETANIWRGESGTAWIDDTIVRAVEVVLCISLMGEFLPKFTSAPHFSLAQIHDAFTSLRPQKQIGQANRAEFA